MNTNIYLKNIEWFAQFFLSETYGWTKEQKGLYMELLCVSINNNGCLEAGMNGVPSIINNTTDADTWQTKIKGKWQLHKYGLLRNDNFEKMLTTINGNYFEQDQKPGMLYPNKGHMSKDLTDDETDNTIAYVEAMTGMSAEKDAVEIHWKGFKIQHFNGNNEYKGWEGVLQHFRDWLKKYYQTIKKNKEEADGKAIEGLNATGNRGKFNRLKDF